MRCQRKPQSENATGGAGVAGGEYEIGEVREEAGPSGAPVETLFGSGDAAAVGVSEIEMRDGEDSVSDISGSSVSDIGSQAPEQVLYKLEEVNNFLDETDVDTFVTSVGILLTKHNYADISKLQIEEVGSKYPKG